jgi:hypothetical protein
MRLSSIAWGGLAAAVIVASWTTTRAALMHRSDVSRGIDRVGPSTRLSPVRDTSLTNTSAVTPRRGDHGRLSDSQQRIALPPLSGLDTLNLQGPRPEVVSLRSALFAEASRIIRGPARDCLGVMENPSVVRVHFAARAAGASAELTSIFVGDTVVAKGADISRDKLRCLEEEIRRALPKQIFLTPSNTRFVTYDGDFYHSFNVRSSVECSL